MASMILYLVRHGESAFNAEGRIQGQLNTVLSALGRRQSLAIAAAFGGEPIDAIYASPLERALETARPVAEALGLELKTDDRLMEINAGVFQGLVWPEIEARYPEAGASWRTQDPDFRIPGGESRRDLMRRGQAAFTAIRESGHQQAIIVAHGGLICAALKALLDIPAQRNPFMLYNGSISMVEWNSIFKLVTLNQIDHLRASGDDLRSRTGDL
jgi:probable phosphoglycerate mutase